MNTDAFRHPILYILMRSDLHSLNAGKAMAQASHASNQFIYNQNRNLQVTDEVRDAIVEWEEETRNGFGTVLVLDSYNEDIIRSYVESAASLKYYAELVIDPAYPIDDGGVILHAMDVVTCGFIFSPKGKLELLSDLDLHP